MGPPVEIVVGIDTSPESLAALDWGLRLADGLGGRLIAVHAVGLLEDSGYRPPTDVASIVREARTDQPGAAVVVEMVSEDGPPAEVLVRVARRERAAMIVVGSRGLGRAPRLLGSTSEAVLAHASLPVLVVPRPSAGEQEPPART